MAIKLTSRWVNFIEKILSTDDDLNILCKNLYLDLLNNNLSSEWSWKNRNGLLYNRNVMIKFDINNPEKTTMELEKALIITNDNDSLCGIITEDNDFVYDDVYFDPSDDVYNDNEVVEFLCIDLKKCLEGRNIKKSTIINLTKIIINIKYTKNRNLFEYRNNELYKLGRYRMSRLEKY